MNLQKYLYESLLDDEDDLVNKGDNNVLLQNIDPQFFSDYSINPVNALIKPEYYEVIDDHILEIDKSKSLYIGWGKSLNITPINEYLPGVDTIKTNHFMNICINDKFKSFDENVICKNLKAHVFELSIHPGVTTIENLNFTQIKSGSTLLPVFLKIFKRNQETLELKNLTIESFNSEPIIILLETDNLPIFKNVKIKSKDCTLKINMDTNAGESNISKFMDEIIDTSYKFGVYNIKKNALDIKKSTFKNILAANKNKNINTIHSESSELFKLKPGVNVDKLFKNLPDQISKINIFVNEYSMLIFEKDPQGIIKQRMPKISQQTDDGWNVRII